MATFPQSDPLSGDAVAPGAATTVLIVGIDFSPMSEHLLRTASNLVRNSGKAEIHCVHVVPTQAITTGFIDALPPSVGRTIADSVEQAHEQLEKLCSAVLSGFKSTTLYTHVRVGNAAEEIPRLAEEVGAHLIVVEAHGRSGIRRMMHRSVAAHLARNAPCSVLTVREKRPRTFEEARVNEPPEPHDEGEAVALDC